MLWLLVRAAIRISRRLLDAVDPGVSEEVDAAIREVPELRDVTDLRVRWKGHRLSVAASISLDSDLTIAEGHEVAHDAEHMLHHRFTFPIVAIIHVEPHGVPGAHDLTEHHRPRHQIDSDVPREAR